MSMLENFRKAQAPFIKKLKEQEVSAELPRPLEFNRPSFSSGLRAKEACAVIAEYKRASPSKGIINLGVEPKEIASLYANAGASAISVLTEQKYFQGDIEYLDIMACSGLPLLRKDFLLDPIQVAETAATKASALLLIIRMLDDTTFDMMTKATETFGLEAVIEIFDLIDLNRVRSSAKRTGITPKLIQVNTRDLDTLQINKEALAELIPQKRDDELWIAASGVTCREDLEARAILGYDAVLVGTGLMQQEDPGKALANLTMVTA